MVGVGEEGVEVVAGALVIVGVVEHRLRVEFLPELAAREGEAEKLEMTQEGRPRADLSES